MAQFTAYKASLDKRRKRDCVRTYGPYEIAYHNAAPRTVTIRQRLDGRYYREVVLSVQEWAIYKDACAGAVSGAEVALRSEKAQTKEFDL